jgi:hypothetical protein|tara:strand:- start:1402 stop:1689 length:288 start_codon:yes stop_codon:yes gene_type:complete
LDIKKENNMPNMSITEANRNRKQGSFNKDTKPGYVGRYSKESPLPKGYGGPFDESFPSSGGVDVDSKMMKPNDDMNIEDNTSNKNSMYKLKGATL